MRSIFIADAHLRRPEDQNYQKLLSFLDEIKGDIGTLYILGDLFEHWIGYRSIPSPDYIPILNALKAVREAGASIVMFEGNHDFHLKPFFSNLIDAEIHPDPTTLTIHGKRVYLCHGDQINTREYGYRILRLILHSRLIRVATALAPVEFTEGIATRMARQSKKKHGSTRARWDFRALFTGFAEKLLAEGHDVVMAGHFHNPFIKHVPEGGTIVSLGDWVTQFSYGEWKDGELTLKEYCAGIPS